MDAIKQKYFGKKRKLIDLILKHRKFFKLNFIARVVENRLKKEDKLLGYEYLKQDGKEDNIKSWIKINLQETVNNYSRDSSSKKLFSDIKTDIKLPPEPPKAKTARDHYESSQRLNNMVYEEVCKDMSEASVKLMPKTTKSASSEDPFIDFGPTKLAWSTYRIGKRAPK